MIPYILNPKTGKYDYLTLSFNHGFAYKDPMMVDFPVDMIYRDIRYTFLEFYHMKAVNQPSDALTAVHAHQPARNFEKWNTNFIYISNSQDNIVEIDYVIHNRNDKLYNYEVENL